MTKPKCENHCGHDLFYAEHSGPPQSVVRCWHTDVCGDLDCFHVCTFPQPEPTTTPLTDAELAALSRSLSHFPMAASGNDAIAWHLEQGKDNGGVTRETLAASLRGDAERFRLAASIFPRLIERVKELDALEVRLLSLGKRWAPWLTGDPFDAADVDNTEKTLQILEGCLAAGERINNQAKAKNTEQDALIAELKEALTELTYCDLSAHPNARLKATRRATAIVAKVESDGGVSK